MRATRPKFSPLVRTSARGAVAAGLAVALITVTASCGLFTDERQETLEAFADALAAGDLAGAAQLTTDPDAASTALQASIDGMGGAARTVSVSAGEGQDSPAQLITSWDLGEQRFAETVGAAGVVETENGMRIEWAPDVLDTRLEDGGRLVYADLLDYDTPVVDRNGMPLMDWQTVTVVTLEAGAEASADAVATLVSDAAPTITGDSIREGMTGADGEDYVVITLRENDVEPIREELAAIEGVQLNEQGRLLTADRNLTSPALRELPDIWEETLREEAGWAVTAQNPTSSERIAGRDAGEVEHIATRLDRGFLEAAQEAVDGEDLPAMIVAMQPSTGGILAIAQNSAADAEGAVSLTGLYAPGSTFKIVTTLAALNAGVVRADQIVNCPGQATIQGRSIPNNEGFDLGQVPLHTAFAQSCNTTQGMLAVQLGPHSLTDAAQSLGLGVDFDIRGLTTVTGNVPVTEGGPARVEAAIGQGQVLASPFGMALAVASLANNGEMVLPVLVEDNGTTADANPDALPSDLVAAVREMMRETVTSGTASAVADIPELAGKTGTAEVGGGGASNGWFVGIAGDIAFATFVEGAGSSAPAVAASGRFLRAVVQ